VRVRLGGLERLVMAGRITGYTVEPDLRYLRGAAPVVTYSMFEHDEASRRNLALAAGELAAMGATVDLVRRAGTWRWNGLVRRSRELTAVCWFRHPGAVERALEALRGRYVAGRPSAVEGSWLVPDVRVSGAEPSGTIPASAHVMPVGQGEAAVVIGLSPEPPLAGMASHPLRVLPCWADHLSRVRPAAALTRE